MAAGGQEHKVEGPENFDMDGLDIDADLATPEVHFRPQSTVPTETRFAQDRSPEGHVPTFLHGPIRPSAEDVDRYDATHVPYRKWCPICVAARREEDAHRRQVGERRGRRRTTLPNFSMDYQELKPKARQ